MIIKEWIVRRNAAEAEVRQCAVEQMRALGLTAMDAARISTVMVDVFRLGVDVHLDSITAPAQGGEE